MRPQPNSTARSRQHRPTSVRAAPSRASRPSLGPPRLLAIMGSGEMAPAMARVHRLIVARLGPAPVPAVLLDTPYGFQENADELTERTVAFFRDRVGLEMAVATHRSADADPVALATALARLREARFVFSGPGSPSYALRAWRGSGIDDAVLDKLTSGGAVVLASAAALTLGAFTVPVYEVYKVGEAPSWLPGLDVLGRLGLPVAVIPHFDNTEGGSHDTRFCYIGERRLRQLEALLPESHFVLGVDSHTALVLDFGAATVTVLGRGRVTVRVDGRSVTFAPDRSVPIVALRAAAEELRSAGGSTGPGLAAPVTVPGTVDGSVAAVEAALEASDGPATARALLALDDGLAGRTGDGVEGTDRARLAFRALLVRLAERSASPAAADGVPATIVDLLVDLRAEARARGDYALGDRIRDALEASGIALRDGPADTTWERRPAR